ncbi:MAG: MBL fold metallo-hydrolase [Candidatus Bathyarchaeota archaeon]|nr:MAG: MBL fold metallo-hydrolase [Candidatus Bathyarchaeota archaeon]
MTQLELIFLGTGGGRFVTITQKRRTAGIRMLSEKLNMHLDPGPGALVHSLNMGLNPQKIRTILVSHSHPDHYTDAEVLIEAMTQGTTKRRGTLAAAHSTLFGNKTCGPVISKYHQQMPEKVIELKPDVTFNVNDMKIITTEARHTDPDTVGFRLENKDFGDIAYSSDTEFFKGVGKQYEGVRLLLLCVMRPSGKPWKGHMTTNDAIKIVEEAGPEMVVMTHFGMQMIFSGPYREAKLIKQGTGIPTTVALDGMHISVGEEIQVRRTERRQKGLDEFVKSKK